MSDSPSKAKDVKTKASVADQTPLSAQAQKRAKNEEDKKKRQHDNFNHMIEHIKHDPQIFQREELKYLRKFVNHVKSRCDIYPCNPDDITPRPVLYTNVSHLSTKNVLENWLQMKLMVKL